jgi:Cu/Ag efflux pump CusA
LLEISGKRGGRIAVANQSVEQRRLEVDLDRRQIALNVRESYWKARAMQALAVLYDEDARYFRQVIDYHEARFREGKLAEVDLLRVRLQGQQIQAAAANARLDSEKAILILAQEMNAVAAALVILAVAIWSLTVIGTEFRPQLDEGSILVETRKLPGISLTDSVEISKRIETRLRAFLEIADVVIKIGRPDFATEAMGINEGDTYLLLRSMSEWHRLHTKEKLIEALDKELAQVPGLAYNFTQPMAMRVDETVSGVKADLAMKIFGDDFDQLDSLSQQVLHAASTVRGAADTQIQLTSGVPDLTIRIDRSALARYGLNVSDVEQGG